MEILETYLWILDNQTILYLNMTIKSVCVIVCKSGLQGSKAEHVLYKSKNLHISDPTKNMFLYEPLDVKKVLTCKGMKYFTKTYVLYLPAWTHFFRCDIVLYMYIYLKGPN